MLTPREKNKEEEPVHSPVHQNVINQHSGKNDMFLDVSASAEDKNHSPIPICPPNCPTSTSHLHSSERGAVVSVQATYDDLTGEVQSFRDPNSFARGSSIGIVHSNSKFNGELNHRTRGVYRYGGYPSAYTPLDVPRHGDHLPAPLHDDITFIKTPIEKEAECNRPNIYKSVSLSPERVLLTPDREAKLAPFLPPPVSSVENITTASRLDSVLFPPRNTSARTASNKHLLTPPQMSPPYKLSHKAINSFLSPPVPEEQVERRLLQSPLPEFTRGAENPSNDLVSHPYHRGPIVSPSLDVEKSHFKTIPPPLSSQSYGTRCTKLPPPPPPLPEPRYSEDQHSEASSMVSSRYTDHWEQNSYTSSHMRQDGRVLHRFFSQRWEEQKRMHSTHVTPQNFSKHNVMESSVAPTKDSRVNAAIELWKSVMNKRETWLSHTQRPVNEVPTFSSDNTALNHFSYRPTDDPKLQAPHGGNEAAAVRPTSTVHAPHAQRRPRSRSIELYMQDKMQGGGASSFSSTINSQSSIQGQEHDVASNVWASTDGVCVESLDRVRSKYQHLRPTYVDGGTHKAPPASSGLLPSKSVPVSNDEGKVGFMCSQPDTNQKLDLNSVAKERVVSSCGVQVSTRPQEQLQEGQTKTEALARHLVRAIQDRKILKENVEELELLVKECNFEIERLHQRIEEKSSGVVDTQVLNATLNAKEREVALCEDEIKRLNSVVERHMARLAKREDSWITKLPNGSLWKQAIELDAAVTEVGEARVAQREAEDRADLLENELEAAVERIRALDKRLVEMEQTASVHRLQVMQSRLGLESKGASGPDIGDSEGSMIPLPTTEETTQWPLAARRVLNRLVSHADGLTIRNSESSRQASLQIQNLEDSCERFRRKLQVKTEELRQLQNECLSFRKEKEMLRLCAAQWFGKLQEVKEEAQLVSELVRISKGDAEETALSCLAAEAQEDAMTKVHAPGAVIVAQANQMALSKCKGFAQEVAQDMNAVSRFLLALREMDIGENNGYQILQNLADGSAPTENIFFDAKTAPIKSSALEIEKRNIVSRIKEKKDFVVRAVERALAEGSQTASAPRDSKTHPPVFPEESGKTNREVSRNGVSHSHRESIGAIPLDKVILHSHKTGEYEDEIMEADMFEEIDNPNFRKKPTRYNAELELETSGPTVSWPSNGIWAEDDRKKSDQTASHGSQIQVPGLSLPPHDGNVGLATTHFKQNSSAYTSRSDIKAKPNTSSLPGPPRLLSNSSSRFNDADDSRRLVNISHGRVSLSQNYARFSSEREENRTTEKPSVPDNSSVVALTTSLSTSQRMSHTNESLPKREIFFDSAYRQGGGTLDGNDGFSSSLAAPMQQERASSASEWKLHEMTVTFNGQQAHNCASTSLKGFQPEAAALYEGNDQLGNVEYVSENDAKPSIITGTPKITNMVGMTTDDESPILLRMDDMLYTTGHAEAKHHQAHHMHEDSTPTKQTHRDDSTDSPAIKFPNTGADHDRARTNPSSLRGELEQDTLANPMEGAVTLSHHETSSRISPISSVFHIAHGDDESAMYDAPQLLHPKERSATMPPHSRGDEIGGPYTHLHETVPRTMEGGAREAGETSAPFPAVATDQFNISVFLTTPPGGPDINSQGSLQNSNSKKQSQSPRSRLPDNNDDDDSMPSLGFFNSDNNVGRSQPTQVSTQPLGVKHLENAALVKGSDTMKEDSPESTVLSHEPSKYDMLLPIARPTVPDSTSSVSKNDKIVAKDQIETLQQQQPDPERGKRFAMMSNSSRQDKETKPTRQPPVSRGMEELVLPRLQSSRSSRASISTLNSTQILHQTPVEAINTEKSTRPVRATPAAPEPQPSATLRSESSAFTRSSKGEEDTQRRTATPSEVETMWEHRPDAAREGVVTAPRQNEKGGSGGAGLEDGASPNRGRAPQPQALPEPQTIAAPSRDDTKKVVGNGPSVAVVMPGGEKNEANKTIDPRAPPRPVAQPDQTALLSSQHASEAVLKTAKEVHHSEEGMVNLAALQTMDTNDTAARSEINSQQALGLKSGKDMKSSPGSHVAATGVDTDRRAAVSRILEKIKKRKANSS